MTLGEIVKEYREKMGLSQRKFAELSGLSYSYISQLEHNVNSKNGQPITPSLVSIQQIAKAMGEPLDAVLVRMDDISVNMSEKLADNEASELDMKIILLVQQLPEDLKADLYDLLQATVAGAKRR